MREKDISIRAVRRAGQSLGVRLGMKVINGEQ